MIFILDDIIQLTVVRSKVLKMVTKNTVYWDMVKSTIVTIYGCFGGTSAKF